jgi:NADP-dependent 3-hydroxy acid dehydrogenase YdfG
MDLQLKDKLAFISGSTSGIGFAIARRLLESSMAGQKNLLINLSVN